jgi:Lrp/AsnC family transcriptional regulator, leucine-responsive regulatory protein
MGRLHGRIRETEPISRVKDADRRFIYEIIEDARAPLAKIAKKLHISKDTAHYTLTKLQKSGAIEHISPVVDLTKLGYHTYHVFFVTNDNKKEEKASFMKHLIDHPNTLSLMDYTARWEVEWKLVAKSLLEFNDIVQKVATKYSKVILQKSKLAIIKGYKSTTIAARHTVGHKKEIEYKPDETDIKILNELHQDGRMSSYIIADKIGLSANAVRYRIKKMEQSNLIRHFTATVNLNALGYHLYTVGIIINSLSKEAEAKLTEYLGGHRFIIRAAKVLGQWDLLLTVLSDNIKNFHKTVKEIEDMFADIIVNYESLISYEEKVYKYLPDIILKEGT